MEHLLDHLAKPDTPADPNQLTATLVSVGAGPPGTGYAPPGWDSNYLAGDK